MDNKLKTIGRFFRPLRRFFVEFCDNSNIHGVRYLTERFLHWSERLWWIIALSVSLWLCGSAAHSIWIEWRDNPMTLSFTEQPLSIVEIPFPTITICPETKTKKTVFDLTSTLKKSSSRLNQFEQKSLNALAHLCPRLHKIIDNMDNFTDETIYDTMQTIALKYEDTFKQWFDYFYKGDGNVVSVLTEEGICFTFNSLNSHNIYTDEMASGMMIVKDNKNASNWSLEKGFQTKSTVVNYPIYDFQSGKRSSLIARLVTFEANSEHQCDETSQGFKLILSTPGDALRFSTNSYQVRLEEYTRISIKPKLTMTSKGLRKFAPNQRQCHFDGERQLRFFKIYSQSNCKEECLANVPNIECGCVKFSMPRDKHTKICGVAKIDCYKSVEMRLSSNENTKSRDKCNCLPACTSIDYDVDIDRTTMDIESARKAIHAYRPEIKFKPFISVRPTRLAINFKDQQASVVERIETLTYSDFLAFCGGLLGVFLGISALSIVELIYYSTIRLYWIFRPLESPHTMNPFQRRVSNIFNRFRFVRGVWAFVVEFCDNSNIHGVLYFTRRGLHWIERLWWIIAFGLALWLCTAMSIDVWQGWRANPVKMTFTHNERPISDVPFPTVTICPQIKSMKHKIDLNPLYFESPDRSNMIRALRYNDKFNTLCHVCLNAIVKTGIELSSYPQYADEQFFDTLQDIAPQFADVVNKCIWQGKVVDCSMYMVPVLTNGGFCFAFNALNSHDIYTDQMAPGMLISKSNPNVTNLKNERKNETFEEAYPRRVHGSGRDAALEISLDVHEQNFQLLCNSADQGFYVIISLPGDDTDIFNFFKVPLLEESVITIRPKLTTTSHGLRKYNPNHRKCFFDSERKLRFFKMYTQTNCYAECLANFTKAQCGCTQFSQPRDRDTPICGVAKIECYLSAQTNLKKRLMVGKELARAHYEACNCLPSCTSIEYNPVIDRVKFDKAAIGLSSGHNVNMSGIQRSKLVIFFEDQFIDTEQREELYTITDLLSICGGLFGLFMGISALSIIEIIYYSSLRWYWILRRPASEQN